MNTASTASSDGVVLVDDHYDLGRRHRWEAAVAGAYGTVGEAFVSNDGRVRPNTHRARGWTEAQARSYCEGWAVAGEEIRVAARLALSTTGKRGER